MTDYKFVEISDDVTDVVVDVEFDSPLPSLRTQAVLREVSDALEIGTRLPIFFEGLSAIQITERGAEMHFRFSRNPDDITALDEYGRDELPRTRTHFVIHVFARLDRVHKLGSVPFPADFRKFTEFTG